MNRIKTLLLAAGLLLGAACYAGNIVHGPWVTEARENRITVVWITDILGKAYVELEDGRTVWDTYAGRRIFRRLHSVTIDGLEPGKVVKYRVCGEDLKDGSNARDPKFGDLWTGAWHRVKTFSKNAPQCNFSVFNDIHLRTGKYSALAGQVDSAGTDFLFLNGDIVTAGNYGVDTLARYQIDPLGALPGGIPVMFARGNHEGRGDGVKAVAEIFPNSDPAPFYYTFRHGPVAVIVLDAGETGRKRSIRYSGGPVYEEYLAAQKEWAAKAMKQKDFRSAKIKICILHVPMIDHPDKNDYLLQRWLNVNMVPMLNKAGIDLMIGADLHEFMYCAEGTMGNKFPIIVNDDARRLEVNCTARSISMKMVNPDGEVEFEKTL